MADKTPADQAKEQKDAKKTLEAEQTAQTVTAEQARQHAIEADEAAGKVHGMPKEDYDKLSYAAQMRVKMNDPNSSLRNQETIEDTIDFQLLNNTNAHTIAAMSGKSLEELAKRAAELETTLKGSAAGDMSPRPN